MPRLPDYNDINGRAVARPLTSVSSNPRAGAIAGAFEGIGDSLIKTGQQAIQKEDKLLYASAKASLLKADMAARQELQTNDPDYETWETKYNDRMKVAREGAQAMLKSRSDRALFEVDAGADVATGAARIGEVVGLRRKDAGIATAMGSLDDLQDVGIGSTDPTETNKVFGAAADIFDGLVEKGWMSAVDAQKGRRDWVQSHLSQNIQGMLTREDYDGAKKYFEAHRSMLDPGVETKLEGTIIGALDNREVLLGAEDIVHSGWGGGTEKPVAGGGATTVATASKSRIYDITIASESAGNPNAVSPKGARGLMQVMPGTSRDPGFGIRPSNGTPQDDVRVGKQYIDKMADRYGGDMRKAWAAYNWGPGNLDDAIKNYGDKWEAHAPDETRDYVKKNVAALGGQGTTQVAAEYDLEAMYNNADAYAKQQGWSPEKTERLKAQVAKIVDRDEGIKKREEDKAADDVFTAISNKGDGFTDPSQLGPQYYDLSPTDRIRVDNIAKENRKPKAIAANGPVDSALKKFEMDNPQGFAMMSPKDIVEATAYLTPAEAQSFRERQAKAKESFGKWSPHSKITGAITRGKDWGGVDVTGSTEDKFRVYNYISLQAQEARYGAKGKEPTDADYDNWFRDATKVVKVPGAMWGTNEAKAYDVISSATRDRITWKIRTARGNPNYQPSQDEIVKYWTMMGERAM